MNVALINQPLLFSWPAQDVKISALNIIADLV
jgi:hypothetical protein